MRKKNKPCNCKNESYSPKDIIKMINEAKGKIDYKGLTPKHIDLHHAKLTPEEQAKFSSMISDTSTTPILIQQRQALRTIHGSRQNPK